MKTTRAQVTLFALAGAGCAAIIGLDEGTPRDAAEGGSSGGSGPGAPADGAAPDGGPVTPATYGDLTDRKRWELFDMKTLPEPPTNSVALAAFAGALFDGTRVTFVPNGACTSGTLASYDPAQPFTAAASWAVFNLASLDPNAVGYVGGAFDGVRIHLAPTCGGFIGLSAAAHQVSAPLDAGWELYPIGPGDKTGAVRGGHQGAAFDGQYVYFPSVASSPIDRYDTREPAGAAASFTSFDTGSLAPPGAGFSGAVFDGRFVTFVPGSFAPATLPCSTVVVRFDTQGDYASKGAWTSFDLKTIDGSVSWCRYGGVVDGKALYLVPSAGAPLIARLDLARPFEAVASWSTFDLRKLEPNATDFAGGAFDGRYVYLVPSATSKDPGVVVRFDSLASSASFSDPAAWSAFDLVSIEAKVDGFLGAAFDGRWVYLVPAGKNLVAARFDARSPAALPPTYHGSFL